MITLVRAYLALTAGLLCALALMLWLCQQQARRQLRDELPLRQTLVRDLSLTDLAVWTEARYTRHPTQADLFTPFQEFPSAPDHFPAGSLLAPPPFELATRIDLLRAEKGP